MVTGGLQTDSEPHPQQQVGSRLDSVPDGPARDGLLSAPLTKFLPVVGAGEHHESELICVNLGSGLSMTWLPNPRLMVRSVGAFGERAGAGKTTSGRCRLRGLCVLTVAVPVQTGA